MKWWNAGPSSLSSVVASPDIGPPSVSRTGSGDISSASRSGRRGSKARVRARALPRMDQSGERRRRERKAQRPAWGVATWVQGTGGAWGLACSRRIVHLGWLCCTSCRAMAPRRACVEATPYRMSGIALRASSCPQKNSSECSPARCSGAVAGARSLSASISFQGSRGKQTIPSLLWRAPHRRHPRPPARTPRLMTVPRTLLGFGVGA